MHRRNTTTIINRIGWYAALCLSLILPALTMAHNGFEHVIGTVVKLENNVLTVKTAKGLVDVRLNEKTEITRDDHPLPVAEMKPGTRVVVDIPEGSKDRVAHSVKVGVSGAPHSHP